MFRAGGAGKFDRASWRFLSRVSETKEADFLTRTLGFHEYMSTSLLVPVCEYSRLVELRTAVCLRDAHVLVLATDVSDFQP